ncbi:MAG TPA: DUF3362 domain-containing protein, partial [bacterium]|nr:DUF3362 domain-containing protein [bacterium]
TDEDMLNLALWLKANNLRADQVQAFLPSPMALASAMYHSGRNPLRTVRREGTEEVFSPKGLKQRRLHKAFLRYHDANNWPLLRETLKKMGRADLIGNGKRHLIPIWQPEGTGDTGGEGVRTGRKNGAQTVLTKHTGLPPRGDLPVRGARSEASGAAKKPFGNKVETPRTSTSRAAPARPAVAWPAKKTAPDATSGKLSGSRARNAHKK